VAAHAGADGTVVAASDAFVARRLAPRVQSVSATPAGGPGARQNLRSTQQWKDVPRGTMDEVSSHVCLNLPFKLTTRPLIRLFYFVLRSRHDRCLTGQQCTGAEISPLYGVFVVR